MNQKLLEQIALAKEVGSNKMAKDFFAKTPGAGGPGDGSDAQTGTNVAAGPGANDPGNMAPDDGTDPGKPGILGGMKPNADASNAPVAPNPDDMTPEQLEELLHLLGSQGGMQQGK